jgi:hypothetical protein
MVIVCYESRTICPFSACRSFGSTVGATAPGSLVDAQEVFKFDSEGIKIRDSHQKAVLNGVIDATCRHQHVLGFQGQVCHPCFVFPPGFVAAVPCWVWWGSVPD